MLVREQRSAEPPGSLRFCAGLALAGVDRYRDNDGSASVLVRVDNDDDVEVDIVLPKSSSRCLSLLGTAPWVW